MVPPVVSRRTALEHGNLVYNCCERESIIAVDEPATGRFLEHPSAVPVAGTALRCSEPPGLERLPCALSRRRPSELLPFRFAQAASRRRKRNRGTQTHLCLP